MGDRQDMGVKFCGVRELEYGIVQDQSIPPDSQQSPLENFNFEEAIVSFLLDKPNL
jgi:hypothetical protein